MDIIFWLFISFKGLRLNIAGTWKIGQVRSTGTLIYKEQEHVIGVSLCTYLTAPTPYVPRGRWVVYLVSTVDMLVWSTL